MYYEEKMIGGVLHWRGSPDGEFTPYTLIELSLHYMDLKEKQIHYSEDKCTAVEYPNCCAFVMTVDTNQAYTKTQEL